MISAGNMLFRYFQMAEREALATRSVDELKSLWNKYDGCNSPDGFSGENIHFVLNQKGEGAYCAV